MQSSLLKLFIHVACVPKVISQDQVYGASKEMFWKEDAKVEILENMIVNKTDAASDDTRCLLKKWWRTWKLRQLNWEIKPNNKWYDP